jgi:hypothetical protein
VKAEGKQSGRTLSTQNHQRRSNVGHALRRWLKRWRVAGGGIGQVLRRPKYLVFALIIAGIFVIILSLLSVGTTDIALIFGPGLDYAGRLQVLGANLGGFFVNLLSPANFLILLLSLAQGVLFALIIFYAKYQKRLDDRGVLGGSAAGILALIAAGCPTCGTSLLMPVLTALFSSAAYTIFASLSLLVMVIAFIFVLFSLRRLGWLCSTALAAERAKTVATKKSRDTNDLIKKGEIDARGKIN